MKILFSLLITTLLFSQNLIDIYRLKGIKALQNEFEKTLQSKTYWLNYLKHKDVKYGYYEDNSFIILCNKRLKRLTLLKYHKGENKKLITFNDLIVGKLGDKEKEGDLKTPIGVYSLIKKIVPKNPFYGPLAFVTNYPNLYDKLNHKDGHGIWIHGRPLDGEKRPDLSKGCIVLNNKDLKILSKIINYKKSILQIYEKPLFAKRDDIASILSMIYKWRWAWERSNLDNYLTFYSKDFKRANGDNFNQFKQYKERVFENKKGKKVEIIFKNLSIVPYQNPDNITMYRVAFYEEYYSPNFIWKGNKEIFVKKEKNKFKIFIEN